MWQRKRIFSTIEFQKGRSDIQMEEFRDKSIPIFLQIVSSYLFIRNPCFQKTRGEIGSVEFLLTLNLSFGNYQFNFMINSILFPAPFFCFNLVICHYNVWLHFFRNRFPGSKFFWRTTFLFLWSAQGTGYINNPPSVSTNCSSLFLTHLRCLT